MIRAALPIHHHTQPLPLTYAVPLLEADFSYETWGTQSHARDDDVLTVSSHPTSHDDVSVVAQDLVL